MTKEFVKYEQALALKELGFDEPCLLSLSWINGYNTYTEKSNEPKAWISSNVEIKYDFSQFKVDFKDVYHVEIQIPLYQQAFRWFREKHNLMFQIFYLRNGNHSVIIHRTTPEYMDLVDQVKPSYGCVDEVVDCYSYEEAESACLDKLIEIIKNK